MTLQLGDSNYFTSIRERTIKICVKKDFSDSLVINLNLNKRKSILSFSQLNTSFLSNHLYNDQLYLWIVYEEVIELVHFDLKIAVSNVNIDIVDVVGYTTLISSYSDFGTFSHIQVQHNYSNKTFSIVFSFKFFVLVYTPALLD